jgi:hypothetical protein
MSIRPYISIDTETTGLDPENCQVIEFGAVIDNWESPIDRLPTFRCYIDHGIFRGEPYAMSMHPKIFRAIATRQTEVEIISPCELVSVFTEWLRANQFPFGPGNKMVVAGKNFGAFDKGFLDKFHHWNRLPMKHRFIDPGNMFFIPGEDDGPPSTEECLRRAGLPPHVNHTAVEDALDVVRLIRFVRDSHG